MTTASPDPLPPQKPLDSGEINLDFLSIDWPLTPLQGKKAYIPGWTKNPFTVSQIKRELDEGRATGVGLLCGQFCNEYGLIFIDIDGEEAIPEIEKLGGGPLHSIFPKTLTITSGKKGKFRMLFRIPNNKIQLLPDRATIKVDKSPWEILWRSRQGAIMGAHPDTDGYKTSSHGGFEYVDSLPDMPDWLYQAISNAFPSSKYRRNHTQPSPFISQNIHLSYDEDSKYKEEAIYKEACEYLDALKIERCNDYEEWLAVGMSLHQVNEALLGAWIEWSMKSDSFQSGACEEKWNSFEQLPGGPNPPEGRGLKTLKAMAKEDGWVDLGGYTALSMDQIKERVKTEQEVNPDIIDHLISTFNDENSVEDIISGQELPFKRGSKSGSGKLRNPPSSVISEYLQEWALGVGWCYDPRFDTFMYYMPNRGFWRREEYRKEFHHVIQDELTTNRSYTPAGFSANLVSDVVELLKQKISRVHWNDGTDKIVFLNGVLEVGSGDFTEHTKEDYITWGLDFNYNPEIDPGPITDWIKRTQFGDEARVQVLRAWLRACLVGHGHELQRFLEIVGPGGRGKSTFANLCCALVGAGNYASTTLNQLEQSRFELSSIKGKRMTLINDSERYGGSAQVFKALTGGDNLRYEEKMKNIGEPFVYTGMVMVAANEPIQTTDNTSGLIRRRLTIEFNRKLYDKNSEARDMIKIEKGRVTGLWKDCLPGLVNWIMQMNDKDMRHYLLDTYELAPSLKKVRHSIMVTSNNLIEWLQAEVVLDEENVLVVGKKIPNNNKEMKHRYFNSDFHLYPSYCEYCDATGSKAVGQKRFIALLLDCCKSQLGLTGIYTFTRKGMPLFKGLAIRKSDQKYKDFPTILPEGKESE
tara:strand:+ start:871 stop:3465 length:2595 start_codon:yes stop_codon:yes gene_type:complete